MKSILLLLFISISIKSSFSQILFQKTYESSSSFSLSDVQKTSLGGFIAVGSNNDDGFLLKLDAYGNMEWDKSFGEWAFDCVYSVEQLSNSSYIISGGTFNTGNTFENILLAKVSNIGDIMWLNAYAVGENANRLSRIRKTTGGFAIYSSYQANSSISLLKTDSNGNVMWGKSYHTLDYGGTPGSFEMTSDGGFILTGTANPLDWNAAIFLIKTDSVGDTLWTKLYQDFSSIGNSVKQTSDGGFVVAGSDDNDSGFLIKTDDHGNVEWAKLFTSAFAQFRINDILQVNDGSYLTVGTASDNVLQKEYVQIMKLNSNGDTTWTRNVGIPGLSNEGNYIHEASDGGEYIISASIRDTASPSNHGLYLITTTEDGEIECNNNYLFMKIESAATEVLCANSSVGAINFTVQPLNFPMSEDTITSNTFCSNVGIGEVNSNADVNVYPIPADQEISIDLKSFQNNSVLRIYELNGREMNFTDANKNSCGYTINSSKWPSGIYFYELISNSKRQTGKFIVSHY